MRKDETILWQGRQRRRSFGLVGAGISLLLLGLPFIGRQQITITNQRVLLEEGFWTKTVDEVEIFRLRDVVLVQTLYQRIVGIGDIVIEATNGRKLETLVIKGVTESRELRETIRNLWNDESRPRGRSANLD